MSNTVDEEGSDRIYRHPVSEISKQFSKCYSSEL